MDEPIIYIYIWAWLPVSQSPPFQWYGPPGPCPRRGVRAFTTISTIATTIVTPTTPTTPRAPPTTTNAAATTAAAAATAAATTTTTTIYYYILCLFLLPLPLLLLLLNPTMYVHMYAPTTGHRGGGYLGGGGEGGTSEAWLIYIYIYIYTNAIDAFTKARVLRKAVQQQFQVGHKHSWVQAVGDMGVNRWHGGQYSKHHNLAVISLQAKPKAGIKDWAGGIELWERFLERQERKGHHKIWSKVNKICSLLKNKTMVRYGKMM